MKNMLHVGFALVALVMASATVAQQHISSLVVAEPGRVFFGREDSNGHRSLWVTDGTSTGIRQITDVSVASSGCRSAAMLNDTLYFFSQSNEGWGLWKSDGTAIGTTFVAAIPQDELAYPSCLTAVGDTLFFVAYDPAHGGELWKTDGTDVGTLLVKDINEGYGTGLNSLTTFAVLDNVLYFIANDGVRGHELWRSDGSEVGTVIVKDIQAGIAAGASAYYQEIYAFGSAIYFVANDGLNGRELWKSDGTEAGTVLLKNISPDGPAVNGTFIGGKVAFSDALYFEACDAIDFSVCGLWRTDGSEINTVLVKSFNSPDSSLTRPGLLMRTTAKMYFIANPVESGASLWSSDGTTDGTEPAVSLDGGYRNHIDLEIATNTHVFYTTYSEAAGYELWSTTGTAESATLLKDINPGTGDVVIHYIVSDGERVYFSADDGSHTTQLWVSDGTSSGTMIMKEDSGGSNGTSDGGGGGGVNSTMALPLLLLLCRRRRLKDDTRLAGS